MVFGFCMKISCAYSLYEHCSTGARRQGQGDSWRLELVIVIGYIECDVFDVRCPFRPFKMHQNTMISTFKQEQSETAYAKDIWSGSEVLIRTRTPDPEYFLASKI